MADFDFQLVISALIRINAIPEVYFEWERSIIPASLILQSSSFLLMHSTQEAALNRQPDLNQTTQHWDTGGTARVSKRGVSSTSRLLTRAVPYQPRLFEYRLEPVIDRRHSLKTAAR